MEGWVSIHRKIQNSPLWTAESFTRGQAWVDLILLASHKENHFIKRGIKVEVKRGQVGVSEKGLADRWKWSTGKVSRFLKYLEGEHQIEHLKTNLTTIISILKYDEYQNMNIKEGNKRVTNKEQTSTINNVNNDNNKKEIYKENILKLKLEKIGRFNLLVDKSQYYHLYSEKESTKLMNLLYTELNNSYAWFEKLKRSTSLSKNEAKHFISKFLDTIYTDGEQFRTLKEIKKHCHMWILKNKPVNHIR